MSVVDGQLRVLRIVAATDPGHVVSPQQVEAQVAESFACGLSAALFGECTVKDGRIEQKNFDSDNVVRLRDMPKVEVIVMPSGGFWGAAGEPTNAVAAPAVLNAVFAATDKRLRLAMARLWLEAINRHGGDATLVHLPAIGRRGKTHFPFSNLNNLQSAEQMARSLADKRLD